MYGVGMYKFNFIGYLLTLSVIPVYAAASTSLQSSTPPQLTSSTTSTYRVKRSATVSVTQTNDAYEKELLQFLDFYNQKQKEQPETNPIPKNDDADSSNIIIDNISTDANKCTSLLQWTDICIDYHNTTEIRKDNRITNTEAADFFEEFCDIVQNPDCKDKDIAFMNLHTSIQLRFLKVVCPRNSTGAVDQDCLDRLIAEVNKENEFGVEITDENRVVIDRSLGVYCSDIYRYSQNYHLGFCEDEPSSMPSSPPTAAPNRRPTQGRVPTRSPNRNPTPSPSARPTSTSNKKYTREFTYMMGVKDANVLQGIVGNGRNDILNSANEAIERILNVRSPRIGNDDELMRIPNEGVEHIYKNEASCLNELPRSTYCVVFVAKIDLLSLNEFSTDDVNDAVFPPLNRSIEDESFLILVNREAMNDDDVIEVYYVSDGYNPPSDEPLTRLVLSAGTITGIVFGVIGSMLCLALTICTACRNRRGVQEDVKNDRDLIFEERDFSDDDDLYLDEEHFEDNDLKFIVAFEEKSKRVTSSSKPNNLFGISSEKKMETLDKLSTVRTSNKNRFTSKTNMASGNAFLMNPTNISSSEIASSSGDSDLSPNTLLKSIEREEKLADEIDEAIHAGDWNAIAVLSDDLNKDDDLSAMSSMQSRTGLSYDPSVNTEEKRN